MARARKDEKTVDETVKLEDSELDEAIGGDSPLWQGEESYISDVEVTSQEGAKRSVGNTTLSKPTVRSS